MGLFNRITHGQDLKDRIKKIQDYQAFLEEADVIMNENITRLYELRKEALAQVQFLTVYVKQLQNHPSVLEESMNRALSFMSDIEKAVMWEARYKDFETDDTNPNAGVGVATAGALTGGLTATIGPTAAMAFATT